MPKNSVSASVIGLGPTIDKSPFIIFKSCGSSSRLVFLKILPTFVILGSFSSLKFASNSAFCSGVNYFISSSAFSTIVMNLRILMTFPFLPTLL